MCLECLNEENPDRGTTTLDDGHYLANLKHCTMCKKRQLLVKKNVVEEEDEEDKDNTSSTVTFDRMLSIETPSVRISASR